MHARHAAWQHTYRAGLWVLNELNCFPREIHLMIARYLAWEDAYCWHCLRRMSVSVRAPASQAYLVYGHDDRKPVCGCILARFRPVPLPRHNRVFRGLAAEFEQDFLPTQQGRVMFMNTLGHEYVLSSDALLRAYRWLAALAGSREPAETFKETWQQREAVRLVGAIPLVVTQGDARAQLRVVAEERERNKKARHVNRKGKRK